MLRNKATSKPTQAPETTSNQRSTGSTSGTPLHNPILVSTWPQDTDGLHSIHNVITKRPDSVHAAAVHPATALGPLAMHISDRKACHSRTAHKQLTAYSARAASTKSLRTLSAAGSHVTRHMPCPISRRRTSGGRGGHRCARQLRLQSPSCCACVASHHSLQVPRLGHVLGVQAGGREGKPSTCPGACQTRLPCCCTARQQLHCKSPGSRSCCKRQHL